MSEPRLLGSYCAVFLFFTMFLAIILSGCISSSGSSTDTHTIGNDSSITVTDTYGNTVSFPHTVKRIICLPGTAAETLVSIGAGDKIVGVSEYTSKDAYLMSRMPNATSVGDWWLPDVEQIISLHPDLVISYGISQSKAGNIDKILAANITVLYVKCYDVRDLANETRMLGKITGTETRSESVAHFSEQYMSLTQERLENVSQGSAVKPRFYFERWTDYTALASDSPQHDILTTLNANNVAGDIPLVQADVSPEWIIDQNPDVIFRLAITGDNATEIRDKLMSRPGVSRIRAVQDGRVYIIYSDMLTSPRSAVGTLYLAKVLYPDRFADIDPVEILHDYENEFLPGYRSEDTFYPSLGKNQVIIKNNTTAPAGV
ncbi:ABC transporter substrate-binding protein [Methanoregula formicica]|uniref:ABC-type Fe3+-hydroxamate transport system, periplasmic component n=1 Tax=Methanoregula formicica (strain DSM 22288 / NBRC 105244 / SMSP) TaxID=593750 RepID=L0HB26_METFS|nr:ABC transporter substrate-binding protein [Methanoregula formicica]AGB01957.1 ABC-type Fe3+-hydroxamate transport system, periplasmic component [Methanoregula formicica SMSP]